MSHPVSPICQKLSLFFSVFSGVLEAPRGRQVGRHTQMHLCGRVAPQVCFYSMGHYPNTALFKPPPQMFFSHASMRTSRTTGLFFEKVRLFSTSTHSSHVSRFPFFIHTSPAFIWRGSPLSLTHTQFFPHGTLPFSLYTHHRHSFFFLLLNRDVNHTFATMEGDDPNPFQLKHKEDAARAWKLEEAKRVLEEHQGVLK